MAYPSLWAGGRNFEMGEDVPLREELIPLDDSNQPFPTDMGIVNFDMNIENGKLILFASNAYAHKLIADLHIL